MKLAKMKCEKCGKNCDRTGTKQLRCVECAKEIRAERKRRYYSLASKKELRRQYNKRYWAANSERLKECNRRWWELNKERGKETNRRWRAANKERCRELDRRKKAANPEKYNEMGRRSYAANVHHRRQQRNLRRIGKKRDDCIKDGWIISRLRKMAHDNGLWELLKGEYENGRRSLRQADAGAKARPRQRSKLSNGKGATPRNGKRGPRPQSEYVLQ